MASARGSILAKGGFARQNLEGPWRSLRLREASTTVACSLTLALHSSSLPSVHMIRPNPWPEVARVIAKGYSPLFPNFPTMCAEAVCPCPPH